LVENENVDGREPQWTALEVVQEDGLSCNASFDFAPNANGQVRVPGVICLSTDMKLAAETGGVNPEQPPAVSGIAKNASDCNV